MSRRRVAGTTMVLLLAACGMKTDPLAPELVQPLPATALEATPTRAGVRLRWRRPTHYSGGSRMRDLERFDIERAGPESHGFALVGSLVLRDQYRLRQPRHLEWIDAGAVPERRYRYRVIAVTVDGARSPPSDPVGIEHVLPVADDAGPS